ncbi:MAG: ABC transporter substrate-binding protein [Candidatus Methanomethylophilus sp.]|nr:ABC transporter substrate-binding protein [Methanomethylophilus sp.]MDD3232896.1 ABC transporter substrate-binding protein [Methanomethylophilus sp.]MDD4221831.1 ABC transporter substrate-binding protein [Methanomethylophilus sp.]MDD4668505.1 ABC transporter substrate-binding protein [Methanomethylophilus sp.]
MSLTKVQFAAVAVIAIIIGAGTIYAVVGMNHSNSSGSYEDGAITITTPTDYNGNTVQQTYTEVPDRVVIGCCTALDIMLTFGLGDKIVGLYYMEETVPSNLTAEYQKVVDRIGSDHVLTGNVSQAVLTDWEPDCVIAWVAWSDTKLGSPSYWNALGCNVWSLRTMVDMDDMYGMALDYQNIGNVFNVRDQTDAFMEKMESKITDVKGLLSDSTLSYAMEDQPPSDTIWFYNDAFINSVLDDCGVTNVFADTGRGTSLAVAYDRADQIDVLFVICYRDNTLDATVNAWAANETLSTAPAIINDRCYAMNLSISYGADPTLLDALDTVVDILSA